jgi:hypothetical protein
MIQRVLVTLDKPLPANAYLALQVDQEKYTNIDVSWYALLDGLVSFCPAGAGSFFASYIWFGGAFYPLLTSTRLHCTGPHQLDG